MDRFLESYCKFFSSVYYTTVISIDIFDGLIDRNFKIDFCEVDWQNP